MGRTVVVTGGGGFIGSHLVERLLVLGDTVRVVDNLNTGKRANIGDGAEFHQISINDPALAAAFAGAEVVFHLAALPSVPRSVADPLETHHECATGTLNVLLAARAVGVRRVVYAASCAAYGDQGDDQSGRHEALAPAPLSPYGAAKLAGEQYCQAFYHTYGLETVCLRYFNVFGERQDPQSEYAAVVPRFIVRMLAGQAPTIYGDGAQSRDFVYVGNIVQGNLLAANAPHAAGQIINLATGRNTTLIGLVDALNAQLGTQISAVHQPARQGDIRYSSADIRRATELLDYTPTVDFESGLARTIAWFRQQG
jgi:UDP-glucose 4-epimerase